MNISSLIQGQSLAACLGPERSDGNYSGGVVGHEGVVAITVGQLRGPGGFYDVAIIEREDECDCLMPLHMADEIRLIGGDA